MNYLKKFNLARKLAVVTGGSGLLGKMHCEALAEVGASVVIFDINRKKSIKFKKYLEKKYNNIFYQFTGSVDSEKDIRKLMSYLKKKKLSVDVLINNAALNPKFQSYANNNLENFNLKQWNKEISVGLTGVFLCSKIIGATMKRKGGVIVNISSDLGIIAPDQRIYETTNSNFKKPITYSVIKHGVIGITKYLSTYYAKFGIRTNCLCPGSVFDKQEKNFVKKLSKLIPMSRMANTDEYKSAIQFLSSDASSYMTGQNLIIDGGRSVW
jgi:NAD(P)-dependent dehydrogenase (short-subunit alcohol dehydrogenase family)